MTNPDMTNPDWYNPTQQDMPTVPAMDTPYAPSGPISPPPPVWQKPANQGVPPPPPMGGTGQAGRFALMAGAVLVVVALIAGIVYVGRHGGALKLGGGGTTGATTSGAVLAAQGYCAALQQNDATKQYSYFSAALQAQIPNATYTAIAADVAKQEGAVTICQVGQATPSADGRSSAVAVTVTRQNGSTAVTTTGGTPATQALTWQFAQTGSAWQLTQMPDATLLPRATIFNYCNAVQPGNYASAYTLFTAAMQTALVSATDYTAVSHDIDANDGHATACGTTSVTAAADGSATAQLALTRKHAETDTVQLAAPITGAALLAGQPEVSLLPRTTAYVFCQDLIAKNYTDAYQQLTPIDQGQVGGSPDALKQKIEAATVISGPITGCKAYGYAPSADQQSGVVSGAITVKNLLGSFDVPSTLTMQMMSPNVWKVNDFTVQGF